jgi:hypothetical protein
MVARWEEALDKLLEMYVDWNTPAGEAYSKDVVQTSYKDAERVLSNLHGMVSHQLWMAEPLYIDPDMMTLVEKASETFEPEPLYEQDLMIPFGFVCLPRPLYYVVHDDEDIERRISYRYILWGVERHVYRDGLSDDVCWITIWHDYQDEDDFPRLHPSRFPQLLVVIPWPWGTTYPNNKMGQWYQVAKPLQTLWRLMQQTISMSTSERASRGVTKRALRADYTAKNITVIRLRRPKAIKDEDAEPHLVDWSHRWYVGGHWRNQFYPSLNAHRQIWINPYIKGPEEKPLELRKMRVFELVR